MLIATTHGILKTAAPWENETAMRWVRKTSLEFDNSLGSLGFVGGKYDSQTCHDSILMS